MLHQDQGESLGILVLGSQSSGGQEDEHNKDNKEASSGGRSSSIKGLIVEASKSGAPCPGAFGSISNISKIRKCCWSMK